MSCGEKWILARELLHSIANDFFARRFGRYGHVAEMVATAQTWAWICLPF